MVSGLHGWSGDPRRFSVSQENRRLKSGCSQWCPTCTTIVTSNGDRLIVVREKRRTNSCWYHRTPACYQDAPYGKVNQRMHASCSLPLALFMQTTWWFSYNREKEFVLKVKEVSSKKNFKIITVNLKRNISS